MEISSLLFWMLVVCAVFFEVLIYFSAKRTLKVFMERKHSPFGMTISTGTFSLGLFILFHQFFSLPHIDLTEKISFLRLNFVIVYLYLVISLLIKYAKEYEKRDIRDNTVSLDVKEDWDKIKFGMGKYAIFLFQSLVISVGFYAGLLLAEEVIYKYY